MTFEMPLNLATGVMRLWVGARRRTASHPVPVLIPAPDESLPRRVREAVVKAILHRGVTFPVDAPIDSWDRLTSAEIDRRLLSYDLDVLVPLHVYEGTTHNRGSVLNAIDTRIALLNGE